LQFLRLEVLARDPNQPVPSEQATNSAAATGNVGSGEVQRLLRDLEGCHQAVGMSFPTALLDGDQDRSTGY